MIQTQPQILEPVQEGPTIEEIIEGEEEQAAPKEKVSQVVLQEVAPRNKLPQVIMAGPGTGPLAHQQGHPAREQAKKKRIVEISDWIAEEYRCREKLFQEKHTDMVIGKMRLRWSSRKIDLLDAYKNMLMAEEPREQYEPMGVEVVKLFGPEEKEFQKEMNEHIDKKMEEMYKAQAEATEVPPPVQQEIEPQVMPSNQELETNSMSSWSQLGLDGPENPTTVGGPATLVPLGEEGRQ